MSARDISQAKNPDLRASLAALRRAAELARQTAIQTGTDLVIVSDGRLVLVDPVTREERPYTMDTPAG